MGDEGESRSTGSRGAREESGKKGKLRIIASMVRIKYTDTN